MIDISPENGGCRTAIRAIVHGVLVLVMPAGTPGRQANVMFDNEN
jgi:hypothetical protein